MAKPEKTPAPCPVCQRPRQDPCGLVDCVLRKTPTAGIPDGLTYTGRVDTSTKEWQE